MTDESSKKKNSSTLPPPPFRSKPASRPSSHNYSKPRPAQPAGKSVPQGWQKKPAAASQNSYMAPTSPPIKFSAFAKREEPEIEPDGREFKLDDLIAKSDEELEEIMRDEGIKAPTEPQPKHEMVFLVAKKLAQKGAILHGEGCLKIAKEGYGFLRFSANSYCEQKGDIFVDSRLIKRFGLLEGQTVKGRLRFPEDQDNYFCLREVESFEGMAVGEKRQRKLFENLKAEHPKERFVLERSKQDGSKEQSKELAIGRIIDIFAPIGKGQRGLIVSPPKSGKTTMMKQIAHAIEENHPEVELTVLLIDERPEEVTDMEESIKGEVIASNFDEEATRHVTVAEAVIAKAKRRVEIGKDVVILLDSITRLARAYNNVAPHTGRTMTGGLDAEALPRPKRFFGAARNIRGGGSLTIIATALVETGTSMDNIIYEEFKGTGNMEILLAREIAEKNIYPAVNFKESSTRRDELLLNEEARQVSLKIREACADQDFAKTAAWINECISRTDDNVLFIEEMKKTLKIED